MTVEEYRRAPELNFSLAKNLLHSPARFKAALDDDREETDAMRVGTLAHAMILEGKNLLDMFAVKPAGMSFATKDGKAWRDAQTLPILKEDDANFIPAAAESVAGNTFASSLIKGCQHKEMPIIGTMYGVKCKALLDLCGTDGTEWVIADLKTCKDASNRAFAKDVSNMHYDLQMAWYSTLLATVKGLEKPPFWAWIPVEKTAPFPAAVYTAEEWMDSGMEKLEKVLSLYKECLTTCEWPMPYKGMQTLNKPAWA